MKAIFVLALVFAAANAQYTGFNPIACMAELEKALPDFKKVAGCVSKDPNATIACVEKLAPTLIGDVTTILKECSPVGASESVTSVADPSKCLADLPLIQSDAALIFGCFGNGKTIPDSVTCILGQAPKLQTDAVKMFHDCLPFGTTLQQTKVTDINGCIQGIFAIVKSGIHALGDLYHENIDGIIADAEQITQNIATVVMQCGNMAKVADLTNQLYREIAN